MKLKFLVSPISKSFFSQLMSTLAIMLVTFFLMICFCSVGQNLTIFLLANQMQIDKKLIYTTNFDFYLTDDEKRDEENAIATENEVNIVENLEYYFLVYENDQDYIPMKFINYEMPSLKSMHYSLASGSYPKTGDKNCVLLPYDYINIFNVGDTISVCVYNINDIEKEESPVTDITVSGFLAKGPLLSLDSSGTSLGLQDIFMQDTENYGVIYSLTDREGHVINPERSNMYIVSPDQGSNLEAVKKSLVHIVQSPAFLFTGQETIASYNEGHEVELIQMAGYCIAAFSLAFSMMLANTLLSLINRQREMSIYYLTGATWRQSIRIVIANQFIPMILGFALGIYWVSRSAGSPLFYIVVPELKLSYVLATILVEMIMFGCAVLPFWIITKRKSPIELFRKD